LLVALWSGKPRHKAGRCANGLANGLANGRANGFANALRQPIPSAGMT
jgi:hypothetical protein